MLEKRRVCRPWCKKDDAGIGYHLRCKRCQQSAKLTGVLVHRVDAVLAKQLGKYVLRDQAVLQQVGDSRWNSKVVFEHIQGPVLAPNEIAPAHVSPDPIHNFRAYAFRSKTGRASDDVTRYYSGLDNLLLMVRVIDKAVQSSHSLNKTRLDSRPFLGVDDPRNDVVGPWPLNRSVVLKGAEGKAHCPDLILSGTLALVQRPKPHV